MDDTTQQMVDEAYHFSVPSFWLYAFRHKDYDEIELVRAAWGSELDYEIEKARAQFVALENMPKDIEPAKDTERPYADEYLLKTLIKPIKGVIVSTNADKEYDYGYAHELVGLIRTDKKPINIDHARIVFLPLNHATYQINRYLSGMNRVWLVGHETINTLLLWTEL